jgi:hypothetical protein
VGISSLIIVVNIPGRSNPEKGRIFSKKDNFFGICPAIQQRSDNPDGRM